MGAGGISEEKNSRCDDLRRAEGFETGSYDPEELVMALYSPWNSPGQNTGVGSLSHLQGIFPTGDRTQVSRIAGRFFTN